MKAVPPRRPSRRKSVANVYARKELLELLEIHNNGCVRAITYSSQEAERKRQLKYEQEDFHRTHKLDAVSRVLFPAGFFAFNLYFWINFKQEE